MIRVDHSYDDAVEAKVRQAFQHDWPATTVERVVTVARRNRLRRRRRTGALSAVAVAASVALIVGVIATPTRMEPPRRPSTIPTAPPLGSFDYADPDAVAILNNLCRQGAHRLLWDSGDLRLPPSQDLNDEFDMAQLFAPVDGVGWFFPYTQPDVGAFCAHTTTGQDPDLVLVHVPAAPAGSDPDQTLTYAAGELGAWSYVVGRAPVGVVSVEVERSDGSVVAAVVDPYTDRSFAAWWPVSAEISLARVHAVVAPQDGAPAHEGDRVVTVQDGAAPSIAADQLSRACREQDPSLPALWFGSVVEPVRIYADLPGLQIGACVSGEGGAASVVRPDASNAIEGGGFTMMTGLIPADGGRPAIAFVVGESPRGGDVFVELDGRGMRARVREYRGAQYFAAWVDTTRAEALLGRVDAVTEEGALWTYRDGLVTHQGGTQTSLVGREHVAEASRRWADAEPAAYRYTLHVGCEWCPQLGEYRIEVHDGRVTSARRLQDSGALSPVPGDLPTIEGLLTLIRQVPAAEAEFDSELGYPTFVNYVNDSVYLIYDFMILTE